MMTVKLVGLPFAGGATAAGLTAELYQAADASVLGHDIFYVGIGVIVALLILAVVIAVSAGRIKQQVSSHERRLWVLEDKGSPSLGRLAALLERECDTSAEVLRRQDSLSQEMARVEQRLVRVETLLRVSASVVTEPLPGLG